MLSITAPRSMLLIRLMVDFVFLSEGTQKFLFLQTIETGRFKKIGLPEPEFLAYFVAVFEFTCGACLPLGLQTRLAMLLLTNMRPAARNLQTILPHRCR